MHFRDRDLSFAFMKQNCVIDNSLPPITKKNWSLTFLLLITKQSFMKKKFCISHNFLFDCVITGRRPLVVVTHKDQMNDMDIEELLHDLEVTYGVDTQRVFFVTNLTKDTPELSIETKSSLTSFLSCCIADSVSGNRYHQQRSTFLARLAEHKRKG